MTILATMVDAALEEIYRTVPPEDIPWNHEEPPDELVQLVESGRVEPCRALDLGCGLGNYAIHLASMGFDMTGVDISPTAIRMAKENAAKRGVQCDLSVADLRGDLSEVEGPFGFAYDWQVLHHILPEYRPGHARNVHRLLEKGGKYLSVCFNEADAHFESTGKVRESRLGTMLYFASLEELSELFGPLFVISEMKTIETDGTRGPHVSNYILMEKR